MTEKEIWKPIKGFPFYEVSNFGRVKSLVGKFTRNLPKEGKILKPYHHYRENKTGKHLCYLRVSFKNDKGKIKMLKVSRLVLENFVSKKPKNKVCCHNDGNPLNNHVSNLRWDTMKGNTQDAVRQGRFRGPGLKGVNHPQAKLNYDKVREIRATKFVKGTQRELARKFKVCDNIILRVRRNLIWKDI